MKELDTINDNISELCAEKNRKKINALFSDESDRFEANKTLKTWKLRKNWPLVKYVNHQLLRKMIQECLLLTKLTLKNCI